MLGLYGMENGQKPEMGEKWKNKSKIAPKVDRGKSAKMARTSSEFTLLSKFSAIFAPVQLIGGCFPFQI